MHTMVQTSDLLICVYVQLRPAAPPRMEMSLYSVQLVTSATSSTQETPPLGSQTEASALNNVETQVWKGSFIQSFIIHHSVHMLYIV